MRIMRLLVVPALAVSLAIAPALAEADSHRDRSLSEELDEAFRELMDTMKPALDELLDTLEVLEEIDSLEHYERPEILPNGDIIIRRREDAPPFKFDQDDEPGVRT